MSLVSRTGIDRAISHVVATDLGVAAAYRHGPKAVTSGNPIEQTSSLLKWYEVHLADDPVPVAIRTLARTPVESEALKVNGLGFVILHRCGGDFYFLIANTWRNENELWETVWYKDGEKMAAFEPFTRPTGHLPTYCVWEMVPLWHEQQAWVWFLESARDESAVRRWLADQQPLPGGV